MKKRNDQPERRQFISSQNRTYFDEVYFRSRGFSIHLPYSGQNENLAAAVVLYPGVSATEEKLRETVSCRLEDFEVPGRIFIGNFPFEEQPLEKFNHRTACRV